MKTRPMNMLELVDFHRKKTKELPDNCRLQYSFHNSFLGIGTSIELMAFNPNHTYEWNVLWTDKGGYATEYMPEDRRLIVEE